MELEEDVIKQVVKEIKEMFPDTVLDETQASFLVRTRERAILYYAETLEDIKYGSFGRFLVNPGRLEALKLKEQLIKEGCTYAEANAKLRDRIRELRKTRVNKSGNERSND